MAVKFFEHMLGFHAAPTFMGLKVASLVSFQKSKFTDFDALLGSYETCFACKGISVFRVAEGEEYVLILFYRAADLAASLQKASAKDLLVECGYRVDDSLMDKLEFLRLRMRLRKTFPHEIGLFLGYPPEDVRGFIENSGRGFVCSGYWKVYSNEEAARELFAEYSACTNEFCLKLEAGLSLPELLMAG